MNPNSAAEGTLTNPNTNTSSNPVEAPKAPGRNMFKKFGKPLGAVAGAVGIEFKNQSNSVAAPPQAPNTEPLRPPVVETPQAMEKPGTENSAPLSDRAALVEKVKEFYNPPAPKSPTVVETPQPSTEPIPSPEQKPQVPIYQGAENKMEVLNNGEKNSTGELEDRSVPFQLRQGSQGFSLAFETDTQSPERIKNLEDVRVIKGMDEGELSTVAVLQQYENSLMLWKDGVDTAIDLEKLKDEPYKFFLNDKVGIEVIAFDPKTNNIVIHKVRPEVPPPAAAPPPPSWRQKLIDIIGPVAIATGLTVGTADIASIPDVPREEPAAHTVVVDAPPAQKIEVNIPQPQEINIPKPDLDPSLQCEETQEYTFKEGDYLTQALVKVNGMNRYVDSNGKIDKEKLYEDLACMLALPQNRETVRKTDAEAAIFLDEVFQPDTQKLMGPPTAKGIYERPSALNQKRGGSSDQLIVNQPGDTFAVPKFASSTP